MLEELETRVGKLLIDFAVARQKIVAVHKGINPEYEGVVFYFIIDSKFDDELSDEISDLDLKIADETDYECDLMEWPLTLDYKTNYPFIGEYIWRRE